MPWSIRRYLLAVITASGLGTGAQAACLDQPGPCRMADGHYHMLAPSVELDAPGPALVFLHGFGSSGANTIGNRNLMDQARARGYTVIAPTGSPRGNGQGHRWLFHPEFDPGRDEFSFLKAVVADAAARTPIDQDRVVLGGFSGGAFMTSYMACRDPNAFYAYLPLAGGFWRPHPENCAGPVRLLHSHGWEDGTVPLEGRALGGGRFRQGDIFATLEIWRDTNGCDAMRADIRQTSNDYWRRDWTDCTPGTALSFILYPGGHSMPEWWPALALDWVDTLEN